MDTRAPKGAFNASQLVKNLPDAFRKLFPARHDQATP